MVSKTGSKRKNGERTTRTNGRSIGKKWRWPDVTLHTTCRTTNKNALKLMERSQDSTKPRTGMRESSNIRTALKRIPTSLILSPRPRRTTAMRTIRTKEVTTRLKLTVRLIPSSHSQGGTTLATCHRQDTGTTDGTRRNETQNGAACPQMCEGAQRVCRAPRSLSELSC